MQLELMYSKRESHIDLCQETIASAKCSVSLRLSVRKGVSSGSQGFFVQSQDLRIISQSCVFTPYCTSPPSGAVSKFSHLMNLDERQKSQNGSPKRNPETHHSQEVSNTLSLSPELLTQCLGFLCKTTEKSVFHHGDDLCCG